jgi:hypothetical protein
MQRLSEENGIFPKYSALEDLTVVEDDPLVVEYFADTYKGTFKDQTVCLKIIKLFDEDVVKVSSS